MIPPIVQSTAGVTLLGGVGAPASDVAEALTIAPCLVAADGGADHALAQGRMPEAVIGDFDSLSAGARARIPPARLHRIAEQDSTDFGKCLMHVAAPFFLALGFLGGRVDHTLSVLSGLTSFPERKVVLIGPEDVAFLAPPELRLDLAPGTRVSLYPMGPVSGVSEGLHWPIAGLSLAPAGRIGTSNRAEGPVCLRLMGPCIVLVPRDALGAVLAGLGIAGGPG